MGVRRFFFFMLVVFASFVYIHETTHAVIFEEYGCSHKFGLTLSGAYTEGTCVGLSPEKSLSLDEAQANVEAVGYHAMGPTLFLAGIFFILFDWYSGRRDDIV